MIIDATNINYEWLKIHEYGSNWWLTAYLDMFKVYDIYAPREYLWIKKQLIQELS